MGRRPARWYACSGVCLVQLWRIPLRSWVVSGAQLPLPEKQAVHQVALLPWRSWYVGVVFQVFRSLTRRSGQHFMIFSRDEQTQRFAFTTLVPSVRLLMTSRWSCTWCLMNTSRFDCREVLPLTALVCLAHCSAWFLPVVVGGVGGCPYRCQQGADQVLRQGRFPLARARPPLPRAAYQQDVVVCRRRSVRTFPLFLCMSEFLSPLML
jgi:hypothetical protein